MLSWEIIKDKNKITHYRHDWNRLFNSGRHEISTSYEWTLSLLESTLRVNDDFFLVIIKDAEKIIGIIPLLMRKGQKCGISITHLFPVSDLYHTHGDLLLEVVNEEVTNALMAAILNLDRGWDVFRLTRLLETSSITRHIENYLVKSTFSYEFKRDEPTYFVNLNCSYENYLLKKSHKFRKNLKHSEKKIAEYGEVRYLSNDEVQDIGAAYDDILCIEKNSWKHIYGDSFFDNQIGRKFYECLLENLAKAGMLHLIYLLINNEPVAYGMGCIKDNRYLFLRTSYQEKFKLASPSTLLVARLIEDLTKHGIAELDFTGEPHEYQTHWTDELRWHDSLFLYNNTMKGKAYSMYQQLVNRKKIRYSGEIKLRKRSDFLEKSKS